MVLLMGKVFFQKVCDPVMNLSDLLVGEAVPEDFHHPIVRELLEINDERGFVNLPG